MFIKLLNRRQTRWFEFLSRFDFKIIYRPEKAEAKSDALTRRSEDLSKEENEHLLHQSQTILKTQNLTLTTTSNSKLEQDSLIDIEQLWLQSYLEDSIPNQTLEDLRQGKQRSRHLPLALCKEENSRLIYENRVYVPNHAPLKLRIIRDHHDTPAAGHPGRSKTLKLISRKYFWPKMRRDIDQFCRNCHPCKRAQISRHVSFETLRPLSISEDAWQNVSMNFV